MFDSNSRQSLVNIRSKVDGTGSCEPFVNSSAMFAMYFKYCTIRRSLTCILQNGSLKCTLALNVISDATNAYVCVVRIQAEKKKWKPVNTCVVQLGKQAKYRDIPVDLSGHF